MQIQVNTDRNIEGSRELTDRVNGAVKSALERFSGQITRVEVHLSDQGGVKGGQADKRCMIEARIEGRRPTAVTHQAATLTEAVDVAAAKLKRSIESTLQRLQDRR